MPPDSEPNWSVDGSEHDQGSAFLAQSPQLYKQMALMTDMPGAPRPEVVVVFLCVRFGSFWCGQ